MFKDYRTTLRRWLPVEITVTLALLLVASFYALQWYNYKVKTADLRDQAQAVVNYLALARAYAVNPAGRGQAITGWGLYLTKDDGESNFSFFSNTGNATVTNASSTRILLNVDLGPAVKFSSFVYTRDTDKNIILVYSIADHKLYVDGQVATKPVIITLSQDQYARQIVIKETGEAGLK